MDAAMVLLAENPGASFIEVAEAAGVGRASLYRHFPTREALLRELGLEAIKATDDATSKVVYQSTSALDAMRLSIEAIVPLGDRFYFLTRIPELDDELVNKEVARQEAELSALIEAAKDEGSIDPGIPTSWAAGAFNSLLYAAWVAVKQDGLSNEQASELMFRTLVSGLKVSE